MRRLILTLVLAVGAIPVWSQGQVWGHWDSANRPDSSSQRVKSITVPDLQGRLVNFPVYSSPTLNNVAKADLSYRRILVNWERLLRYNPSPQLIHLVLAHEAGHLLHQDLSAQREDRADYYAGRTMRIEGYTTRDMAVVRQDMLRILGRGDSTHAPAEQRVRITMQGYNSVPNTGSTSSVSASTSRPASANPTFRPPAASAYDTSGGWRRFGQSSLR